MNECWINVYEYPTFKDRYFYSHCCIQLDHAIKYASKEWNKHFDNKRITRYRLHVKLKDKPGIDGIKYPPWRNFNHLKKIGIIK